MMIMNWLAAGQVKSRDSKGYETAFYWEKPLLMKRSWGRGGEGGVAAQAHRVL